MKLIVFEKINELQDEKVFQEMIDYLNELNASRAKILNITNRIIEKKRWLASQSCTMIMIDVKLALLIHEKTIAKQGGTIGERDKN